MPLKKDIDYIELINVIAKCRGGVFCQLESDNINMKSALSQYVFIFCVNNPSMMDGATLVCEDASDYEVLADYLELT